MTISPAGPDDLTNAFHLLYGPDASDDHVTHAFRLVARGELNPADLLVARSGDAITGAAFCQRLPGAVAVIWPPRAADDDPAVEDALATAALDHVTGVKVVQAFLPPEEAGRAAPLLRAGFRRVTRVWQMESRGGKPPTPPPNPPPLKGEGGYSVADPSARSLTGSPPPPSGEGGWGEGLTLRVRPTLVPYPAGDAAEFQRTLLRAHDDSRDCPELHGVRTPDEVLAGYRDCAPDLSRWWLARLDGEPVGVLILGPGELSFVGVVPERRGRGIGRALAEAAVSWHPDLSLIVDERNEPAVALYRSLGFQTVGSRDVYLWLK